MDKSAQVQTIFIGALDAYLKAPAQTLNEESVQMPQSFRIEVAIVMTMKAPSREYTNSSKCGNCTIIFSGLTPGIQQAQSIQMYSHCVKSIPAGRST